MPDLVAGIRFERSGPLVFCYTDLDDLATGRRVLVASHDGTHEGIVAVPPQDIIAAPALEDAPRVVGVVDVEPVSVIDVEPVGDEPVHVPSDVVFLPADNGSIGPSDLVRALALADLPIPESQPAGERRGTGECR